MSRPIKRFATSALALLLTVAMLVSTVVTAGAIYFSGIAGGGGLQHNSNNEPTSNRFSVAALSEWSDHLVGYRFSVVTKDGKLKSGTSARNVFLFFSEKGKTAYNDAYKESGREPKTVIRQNYKTNHGNYVHYWPTQTGCFLDTSLGISDLPLSPDGIEEWCTDDGGDRLNALLIAAGVIEDDAGLAILDSTDRILVEPIFELTMHGQFCVATVTEIGVYEYDLYKDGYNDLYGCTYTSQNSGEYVYGGDYSDYVEMAGGGAILEAILRATNNKYPSLLYEDATGLPTVNGSPNTDAFWLSAPTDGKTGIPYIGTDKYGTEWPILSCEDLIRRGYGVAVVWTDENTVDSRIKLIYNVNGGTQEREFFGGYSYFASTGLVSYESILHETIVPSNSSAEPTNWTDMGLKRDGYTLNSSLSWNTNPNGTGTSFNPSIFYSYDQYKTALDAQMKDGEVDRSGVDEGTLVLYAIWEKKGTETETPKQLIIKYHTNGGMVGSNTMTAEPDYIIKSSNGVDVTTTVSEGKTTTLANWTNWKLTRDGYTLNEDAMWKPNASGAGQTFTRNTPYSYDTLVKLDTDGDGVVILYAVWDKEGTESEEPDKIYLRYHTNGGTVSKSDLTQDSGYVKYHIGSGNYAFFDTIVCKGKSNEPREYSDWGLAKEGYILNENLMWNTRTDGNGKTFTPGVSCSYDKYLPYINSDGVVILYAVWDKEGTEPDPEEPKPESITVVYSPNGGSVGNGYTTTGGVIYKSGKRVETVFPKNGQTARLCAWDDFGLTRSGYELWTLDMWNPSAKGDGESLYFSNFYSYDDLIGFDTDKDGVVILYAVWQKQASDADLAGISYTIYFYVDGKKAGLPFDGAIIHDNYYAFSGKIKRTNVRKGETSTSLNTSSSKEAHLEFKVYQKMSPDGAEFILFDENITAPLGTSATYTRKAYFYSINYYSNSPDGSSIVVPDVHYKIPGHDATISPLVPFCSGWEFVEWNTKADGSGVGYAPEDVYGRNERLDLYAIWKPSPIRITIKCYIDNRPANFMDGSVVLSRQDGATIEDIALPTDKSSYTVSGVDGCKYVISAYIPQSDEPYYPIAEASASNPLVAKAVEGELVVYEYSIYYYTITYKENLPAESSASVSNMPVPNPQYVLRGEEASISGNSPRVTDSRHTFVCWRTTADKTGNRYRPNQTVVLVNSPLVLYAQWINIPSGSSADLVVETYINGQRTNIRTHGLDVRAEQAVTVDGEEYVIDRYLSSVAYGHYYVALPFKSPYRVITTDENGVDWYLTADGSYTTTVTTLPTPTSSPVHRIYYYTITYLPNPPAEGDVWNMPEKQYALKGIEERLSTLTPTREDEYGFVNWNTHGDGTGTAYAKGVRVTLTAPLILHAQWKKMMCELVFEAIVQGATTKQFVDDLPGAIWVETEEGSYPIGKNGTVTVTLPKGTKYRLRAIYETGGTVYPYTAKGSYEDTEFTLTKSFTHHGIYYYAINYFYGNTALETPARHYKLHGIDTLVSSDEPDYNFGTRFRFLNTWDQPDAEIKYEPGAVYNLDQKGDLYALVGMRVAYNANGGAVGEDYGLRSDGLITNNGVPVNILLTDNPPFPPIHYASSFSLSIPYYEFGGWNSEKDGTGVEYKEGSSGGPADFLKCETVDNGEYTVLYADWTPLVNTVSFEARPEEYGAVRFGSREIVAVSGIPRGSTMKIGSSLFYIVVARDCTVTRHYADGTQEDASYPAGRSVIIRPDPEDDTAEYSYSFVGWEGIIETITQDATVVALFDREGVSEPTEPTPSNNTDIAIVPTKVNGDVKLGNQFSLSATVINNSDIDITPEMGIDAVVEIRRSGDTEATAVYRIENICVPKRGTNNATADSVFLTTTGTHTQYTLFDNTNLIYTSAVIDASKRHGVYKATWTLDFSNANGFADADSSNDSGYAGFRVRVVAEESNPSRPVYQTDIPSSFENKGPQEESTSNSFSWAYYEYNPSNPSKFIKREMSDKLQITLILTPENEGGLKEKEVLMAGVPDFITRAGYGFSLHRSYTGIDSGANASSVSAGRECVGTLTALMSYPEFNYSEDVGMYSKLLVSEAKPTGDSNSYFLSLPEYPDYQSNDINDRYAHYIPMWYPDGDYQPVSKFSGLWCPIGELEATVVQSEGRVVDGLTGKVDAEDSQEEMERMRMWTNKYTIQGSMYDDIYITH